MDGGIAALIGSGITALVSLFAMILNNWVSIYNLKRLNINEIAKMSFEYKIRQLNELYGPLIPLLEENQRLAQKLRENKPDAAHWRLLDHLPLSDDQDRQIAVAIIAIYAKIEELLISKGGLISGREFPKSFHLFLGHFEVLKMAFQGKDKITIKEYEYYPLEFDADIRETYQTIKKEIEDLIKASGKLSKI